MSGKKQLKTFERDNLLVDIIFQHKGKDNAIFMKQLATILTQKGYKTSVHSVNARVSKIVLERHLPICSLGYYGYYWGASKQDFKDAIDELQSKINGHQKRVDLLKSFIYE